MSGQKKASFGISARIGSSLNKFILVAAILFMGCEEKSEEKREQFGCVERTCDYGGGYGMLIKFKGNEGRFSIMSSEDEGFFSNLVEGDFAPGTCYNFSAQKMSGSSYRYITYAKIITNADPAFTPMSKNIKHEEKMEMGPNVIIIYGSDKQEAMDKAKELPEQHKDKIEAERLYLENSNI